MLEKPIDIIGIDIPKGITDIKGYLEFLNPELIKVTTKDFKEAFRHTLLNGINFPEDKVFFAHKPKFIEADTYITYFILNEIREDYAGDMAMSITWKVQVNIYTKEDYDNLKEEIIKTLEDAGCVCYDTQELYLDDLECYHIPLRFKYKMIK